jgi:hypothetical protein
MESLIQEIYDEIKSPEGNYSAIYNQLIAERSLNNQVIRDLELSTKPTGDLGLDAAGPGNNNVGMREHEIFKSTHPMFMEVMLRDKQRIDIQIEHIDNINNTHIETNAELTNEELLEYIKYLKNNQDDNTQKKNYKKGPQVKSTVLMDLPESNNLAISNKLKELKNKILQNNEEITRINSAFKSGVFNARGRHHNGQSIPHQSVKKILLRDKERLKVQLDHTNKIWEKYNYDTQRNAQNHEIEQLKVTMADTQCIIQNHEIEQLKISVADTQRIAQNHEIEQLKVTMALMIKSQEKLELKNKELEEQIKEATDRQNQRWWQRS